MRWRNESWPVYYFEQAAPLAIADSGVELGFGQAMTIPPLPERLKWCAVASRVC